jgi:hypothetical protein
MMGLKGQVKQLYLFHHDPSHGDDKIDQMVDHARRLVAEQGGTMRVEAAREGLEVSLSAVVKGAQA